MLSNAGGTMTNKGMFKGTTYDSLEEQVGGNTIAL